jgi:hypothetical protein
MNLAVYDALSGVIRKTGVRSKTAIYQAGFVKEVL